MDMLVKRLRPVKPFSYWFYAFRLIIYTYSAWYFANSFLNIREPGPEHKTPDWPLILVAYAIIALGFTIGLRLPGRPKYIISKFRLNFFPSANHPWIKAPVILLCGIMLSLHFKTSVLERVRVHGESMAPTYRDGNTLWIEKLSVGIILPRLNFPFGAFSPTGKFPRFGIGLPARGDTIVIRYPELKEPHLIKRLIGLPGDQFRFAGGNVFINGRKLNETYLGRNIRTEALPEIHQILMSQAPEDMQLLSPIVAYSALNGCGESGTVPQNSVMVLGDNRRFSLDSRSLGFIPSFYIIGTVLE